MPGHKYLEIGVTVRIMDKTDKYSGSLGVVDSIEDVEDGSQIIHVKFVQYNNYIRFYHPRQLLVESVKLYGSEATNCEKHPRYKIKPFCPECRAEEERQRPDMVNHPPHYNQGKVECIDAIEAATEGLAGIEAHCTGTAIKYLWRWKRKGGLEDLKKAKWYIDAIINRAGEKTTD